MTSVTIEVPDGYTAVTDGDVIRIEKLPEPESQEEWMPYAGELIEVSDSLAGLRMFRYFKQYSHDAKFPWEDTEGARWIHARPLSNPLIVQFHPHDGGECPCPGQRVVCLSRNGIIFTDVSDSFDWDHNNHPHDIIGWAPVKGDK